MLAPRPDLQVCTAVILSSPRCSSDNNNRLIFIIEQSKLDLQENGQLFKKLECFHITCKLI